MLDLMEKIEYSLGGFLVLAIVVMFFYPGLSATVSDVPAPTKTLDKPADFMKSLSAKAAEMHDRESKQADMSREAGPGAQKKEYKLVPQETIERLSDKRNVAPELQLASSEIDAKGRELKLKNISDQSLLNSLGFQAGDVIRGLNGKPIPFNDEGALWDLYNEQMQRFRDGEAIIVTFSRNGVPTQFHFTAENLKKALK